MKENFIVTGMTCSACSAHVEKAVGKVQGVESVAVNLMTGRMNVAFDETRTSVDAICAAVEAEGYGARRAEAADSSRARRVQDEATRAMRSRLQLSVAFLLPLFYVGMGHMMNWPLPHIFHDSIYVLAAVQIVFLLPILVANRAYFTVGFSRLMRLAPNMDTLVALGAAAGIVYSLISLALYDPLVGGMPEFYFESAGMILSLVTVGKYLEQNSRGKTTDAIASLLALAPESAVVVRDGLEMTVPLAEVVVGDRVIVRQGGRIPVDGTVIEGEASVDESSITGESVPVDKHPGKSVMAATVNRSGYLELTATRVGADTTLAQIVRLMEEAGSSKAPIARLADRVSGVFVPAVIAIALCSACYWYFIAQESVSFALSIGIAVLVISCPCALGLATPVAIMVGTGKAAEHGILIKSAESLETLHKVDTIVLDKTGTVTLSQPRLAALYPLGGLAEEELLRLAASLEQRSEHPLALAVVEAAAERAIMLSPAVEDFASTAGGGVEAKLEGKRILGGNARLMAMRGIDLGAAEELARQLADEGKTPLYFAVEEKLCGVLALAAPVKEESFAAIRAMQDRNVELVLLTGDNRRTAEAIGREIGISRILAEVLPQEKEACIAALQREGRCVAMVGDGINDAPALARADVGIAIGAGTDIAIESADVVLMKSDLRDVVTARELSRSVIRNVKENLFWAFFYNSIGIPVAAGVFYALFAFRLNPMFAAAAMSMSSVCVVSNALRLRRWKAPEILAEKKEETHNESEETKMNTKTMKIEGMMCMHCSGRVEQVLNAIPGVSATVDLAAGQATVCAEQALDDAALKAAVEGAGYQVISIE